MTTRQAATELAILTMLQQHQVMTMDEIMTIGQPDFTWGEMFLAIDRLSRQQLIMLYRVGPSYHMSLMNHEWPLGQEKHHEEPAAHIGNTPVLYEAASGFL